LGFFTPKKAQGCVKTLLLLQNQKEDKECILGTAAVYSYSTDDNGDNIRWSDFQDSSSGFQTIPSALHSVMDT